METETCSVHLILTQDRLKKCQYKLPHMRKKQQLLCAIIVQHFIILAHISQQRDQLYGDSAICFHIVHVVIQIFCYVTSNFFRESERRKCRIALIFLGNLLNLPLIEEPVLLIFSSRKVATDYTELWTFGPVRLRGGNSRWGQCSRRRSHPHHDRISSFSNLEC